MTESPPDRQTRRERTTKAEIIFHLAAWWMGGVTPEGYAASHGLDARTLRRWIRTHGVFKSRVNLRKPRERGAATTGEAVAPCRFVTAELVGDIGEGGGRSC
jgi:carbamoylphosphate synthase small subunit